MRVLLFIISYLVLSDALSAQDEKFNAAYERLLDEYAFNSRIEYDKIDKSLLDSIQQYLIEINYEKLSKDAALAFGINAYNFTVIKRIVEQYPLKSVKEVPDFFTLKSQIGAEYISLDELEQRLIQDFSEPGIHLLLNCGAISCPDLLKINAEQPIQLFIENNLRTKQIVDIDEDNQIIHLSSIFYWYESDFGGRQGLIRWLQKNFPEVELSQFKLKYQSYNWALNELNAEDYLLYYPTMLYGKGGMELRIFNNYYTQLERGVRSNFFSSFLQMQFGTAKKFNWGFDIKWRSVNAGDVGIFSALKFENRIIDADQSGMERFSRAAVSGLGPRVKYQPFKDKPHINFVHSIYVVPVDGAEGNENYGYFDFQNIQIFNNAYIEKAISVRRRLFYDIGLWIENIKFPDRGTAHFMQVQLPFTSIYSYFPNPRTSMYVLGNFTLKPVMNKNAGSAADWNLNFFSQTGAGFKYYLTEQVELELLYTYFYDGTPGRTAHTFNMGLRLFRF
jgi:hypothetical protein